MPRVSNLQNDSHNCRWLPPAYFRTGRKKTPGMAGGNQSKNIRTGPGAVVPCACRFSGSGWNWRVTPVDALEHTYTLHGSLRWAAKGWHHGCHVASAKHGCTVTPNHGKLRRQPRSARESATLRAYRERRLRRASSEPSWTVRRRAPWTESRPWPLARCPSVSLSHPGAPCSSRRRRTRHHQV